MIKELPTYLSLAAVTPSGLVFDREDISEYTADVLTWSPGGAQTRAHPFRHGPRPRASSLRSSAASERVFSLVESMFGADQISALADQLQGSAMLNYNKRVIG